MRPVGRAVPKTTPAQVSRGWWCLAVLVCGAVGWTGRDGLKGGLLSPERDGTGDKRAPVVGERWENGQKGSATGPESGSEDSCHR